jgi:hypothetical protein
MRRIYVTSWRPTRQLHRRAWGAAAVWYPGDRIPEVQSGASRALAMPGYADDVERMKPDIVPSDVSTRNHYVQRPGRGKLSVPPRRH